MKSRKMKKILIAVFATVVLALFSIGGLSCDESSSGYGYADNSGCEYLYSVYGSCNDVYICWDDYGTDVWYETGDGWSGSASGLVDHCLY